MNQLFKKAKRTGNFHQYKRRYFQTLNPKNPKKFWKAIEFNKQSNPILSLAGIVANSDVDKANLLNSIFWLFLF